MIQEKPKVLYVDDLPMNLKLFEATFRNDYNLILTEFPAEVFTSMVSICNTEPGSWKE